MKKSMSVIISAVVILGILLFRGFITVLVSESKEKYDKTNMKKEIVKELSARAIELNKSLPMQLDPYTTLVAVEFEDNILSNKFIVEDELIPYLDDEWCNEQRDAIIRGQLKKKNHLEAMEYSIGIKEAEFFQDFRYFDRRGNLLHSIFISGDDLVAWCLEHPASSRTEVN